MPWAIFPERRVLGSLFQTEGLAKFWSVGARGDCTKVALISIRRHGTMRSADAKKQVLTFGFAALLLHRLDNCTPPKMHELHLEAPNNPKRALFVYLRCVLPKCRSCEQSQPSEPCFPQLWIVLQHTPGSYSNHLGPGH